MNGGLIVLHGLIHENNDMLSHSNSRAVQHEREFRLCQRQHPCQTCFAQTILSTRSRSCSTMQADKAFIWRYSFLIHSLSKVGAERFRNKRLKVRAESRSAGAEKEATQLSNINGGEPVDHTTILQDA